MARFPETAYTWRRMKLTLAELLVVSTAKGDHTLNYMDRLKDACDAIREYRETYYPSNGRINLAFPKSKKSPKVAKR